MSKNLKSIFAFEISSKDGGIKEKINKEFKPKIEADLTCIRFSLVFLSKDYEKMDELVNELQKLPFTVFVLRSDYCFKKRNSVMTVTLFAEPAVIGFEYILLKKGNKLNGNIFEPKNKENYKSGFLIGENLDSTIIIINDGELLENDGPVYIAYSSLNNEQFPVFPCIK